MVLRKGDKKERKKKKKERKRKGGRGKERRRLREEKSSPFYLPFHYTNHKIHLLTVVSSHLGTQLRETDRLCFLTSREARSLKQSTRYRLYLGLEALCLPMGTSTDLGST